MELNFLLNASSSLMVTVINVVPVVPVVGFKVASTQNIVLSPSSSLLSVIGTVTVVVLSVINETT